MKIHARLGKNTWTLEPEAVTTLVDAMRVLGYPDITERNWWRRWHGLDRDRGRAVLTSLMAVMGQQPERFDPRLVSKLKQMREADAQLVDRWTVLG